MLGDLLGALTRVRGSWLMKAFEVVYMNGIALRMDDFLQNDQAAFVRSTQVSVTSSRHLLRKLKRATNFAVHRNPAMC